MDSIVGDIQTYSTLCFLNCVVQTNTEEIYLVLYTEDSLQLIETVYVDKETLGKIPKKGLLTNFVVQDDFLRCDAMQKIKVNMDASELLGKKDFISFRGADNKGSFFSFLSDAGSYIYIDEKALIPCDDDEQIKYKLGTYGYTNFKNIKFSQTTMTAYFHIVTPDGLENRNIIYLNDKNYLQMNEFIIGVAGISDTFPEECVALLGEAIDVNGKVYTLYKVKMMSLYNNTAIPVDTNLVNLSCYMSLRYENAINLLEVLIESITEQEEQSSLMWAGGNNSHKSNYGVLFKSTGEKYSKNKCAQLIDTIMRGYISPVLSTDIDKESALEKVLEEIIYPGMSEEEKHLRLILANIMILNETKEDILITAIKYKENFRDKKFSYDKFLYWVRCYLYLNRRRITIPGKPVLHSNFIKAGTIVTEGIFYGEH